MSDALGAVFSNGAFLEQINGIFKMLDLDGLNQKAADSVLRALEPKINSIHNRLVKIEGNLDKLVSMLKKIIK